MRRAIGAVILLLSLTLLHKHGGKTGKELEEEARNQRSEVKNQKEKVKTQDKR
ncbi:MAG: hypothetical protein GXP25_24620 [Planctomycetes bacterium]|nr:hypothetical protein [Planctomycetota bacterium]